jgi:hypothetical protein
MVILKIISFFLGQQDGLLVLLHRTSCVPTYKRCFRRWLTCCTRDLGFNFPYAKGVFIKKKNWADYI